MVATQVKLLFLKMLKFYPILIIFLCILSCKNEKGTETYHPIENIIDEQSVEIKYANGFTISYFKDYKIIKITNPWPNAEKHFTYALVEENGTLPNNEAYDAIVHIPIKNIVVTSTTHIPSLEMLGVENTLVGFPNLEYISSEKTRNNIKQGKIIELGKNEDINTEMLIDLAPDVVIGFGIDGNNTTFSTIQKTGIPVVYNADWTETTPLGKAEWIKFFGAFFNKEKVADSIFKRIETDYNKSKQLAASATFRPTVLSGAMYKDVWYLPQGDSWAAQFIADAHGDYLWKDSEGTGSLSLNLEEVLENGQNADFWIGPSQFTSMKQLRDAHSVYDQFKAFKNNKVFSFTNKKGETGGVIYYELAPNRPDLVLKDIIKILHPNLLPGYEPYFFRKLN